METVETKYLEENPKFCCDFCNFKTNNKKDYKRHNMTPKHLKNMSGNENCLNGNILCSENGSLSFFTQEHKCIGCGKIYKERSGLWKHQKKCKITEENTKTTEENITIEVSEKKPENPQPMNESLLIEFIKQNQEFQKQLLEVMKENIGTHNNTTNNTTNNKFNLNIFLNEKCKDAFNISDFINGIDVGFKDFENFGTLGYVSSINNILIRELKGLDVYKRPIHCSDLKREVIHIKDNDTWVKDEDKKHMKRAIKLIEHKNIKLIPDWVKANPAAEDYTSKKHDQYNKMLYNVMGEMKDEDNERNYEKIIKNVAKEILIDKEK
jgi:hypothetical protein